MDPQSVQIQASWKSVLNKEFESAYFDEIVSFIKSEKSIGKKIYPPGPLIFNAFNSTPFDKLKVVILGQDPYHNPGEAMGLCFSVPREVRVPPSLKNIYKELHQDLDIPIPNHGDLSAWAAQGIFLLNAMLTVEHKKAGSHKKIGWQKFTDAVIRLISENKTNIVFVLWGNFAKGKRQFIDDSKHLILESAHPSPLAGGAFFNNNHFSQINNYLISNGKTPIEWKL